MEAAEHAALPVILKLFSKLAQIQLQPFLRAESTPCSVTRSTQLPELFLQTTLSGWREVKPDLLRGAHDCVPPKSQ